MRELVQALLIAGTAAWAAVVVVGLWARHRLRRRLRIHPKVRTHAPTAWLASPSTSARLHRRLRVAAAAARASSSIDGGLDPLAHAVVEEALALEPRIIAVRGTGRAGLPARREVARQVDELEAAARRLSTLAHRRSPALGGGRRIQERLTALELARQELDDLDLDAGLLRHA